MRALAWYVERYSEELEEGRKAVLLKMFTWITGYKSYRDCYTNIKEVRLVTDKGIVDEDD
jgi:hypothetical protein